jgi:hypothetical protein
MTAGYSGTPLAKKLTLKDGFRCWFDLMPATVVAEIEEFGLELEVLATPEKGLNAVHVFVTDGQDLQAKLTELRNHILPDGQIWVSWPKKGSGMESALDQSAVQRIGLAAGLVDIKKCAVNEVWSGLKFVIPKDQR